MSVNDKLKQYNDAELIAHYKKSRNADYVGVLYERYSHLILGVCLKYLQNEVEAQDLSVSIFEKLLTDLVKHDVLHFPAWLHMVCKNQCLMHLRALSALSQKQSDLKYFLENDMENANDLHHEKAMEKEVKLNMLEDCLQLLTEEQKRCIELFYLQEKSYQEIVSSTKLSANNVKSFIQNGKRNLKNCLQSKK
jgi:RNA polymerase sigma factor (sigma-70 family)